MEAGFHILSFPPEEGGMGMPHFLFPRRIFQCRQHIAWHVLLFYDRGGAPYYDNGSEELKKMFLPKMISGEWGGTMCLTEPGAGSDVGALKTKAVNRPTARISSPDRRSSSATANTI